MSHYVPLKSYCASAAPKPRTDAPLPDQKGLREPLVSSRKACVSNDVRDWNMLQGMTHQSDEHIQRRRDLDARLISVESALPKDLSGCSPGKRLAVAITTVPCFIESVPDLIPMTQFRLSPGETRAVGINPYESTPQYLFIFDSVEYDAGLRKPLAEPYRLSSDGQIFVVREGYHDGEYYIQSFQTSGYSSK